MKRVLPALGALLVATSLAWAQFKGPDVKPRGHTPTSNPQSFVISGVPVGSQKWAYPLAVNLLFPANFVGSSVDGYPGVSCGSNPSESDTYIFKCAGSVLGSVVLAGPAGAALVQQNAGSTSAASTAVSLTNNVVAGNTIVIFYAEQSTSFSPTFARCTGLNTPVAGCPAASTATIGTIATCPVSGTPVQDPTFNESVMIAYANVTGPGTLAMSVSVASPEVQILNVSEFRGILSSPLDACGAGTTGGAGPTFTQPLSSASSGGTGVNDIILAAIGQNFQNPILSGATAGYTQVTGVPNVATDTLIGAYNTTSAPSTFQVTSSGNGAWAGVALALKTTTGSSCAPTFTTTGSSPQLCLAGQRFEMDAPGTVSGTDIGITIPAHTP